MKSIKFIAMNIKKKKYFCKSILATLKCSSNLILYNSCLTLLLIYKFGLKISDDRIFVAHWNLSPENAIFQTFPENWRHESIRSVTGSPLKLVPLPLHFRQLEVFSTRLFYHRLVVKQSRNSIGIAQSHWRGSIHLWGICEPLAHLN